MRSVGRLPGLDGKEKIGCGPGRSFVRDDEGGLHSATGGVVAAVAVLVWVFVYYTYRVSKKSTDCDRCVGIETRTIKKSERSCFFEYCHTIEFKYLFPHADIVECFPSFCPIRGLLFCPNCKTKLS